VRIEEQWQILNTGPASALPLPIRQASSYCSLAGLVANLEFVWCPIFLYFGLSAHRAFQDTDARHNLKDAATVCQLEEPEVFYILSGYSSENFLYRDTFSRPKSSLGQSHSERQLKDGIKIRRMWPCGWPLQAGGDPGSCSKVQSKLVTVVYAPSDN
jgi:hypothetical protein